MDAPTIRDADAAIAKPARNNVLRTVLEFIANLKQWIDYVPSVTTMSYYF
jgi:hypothetical protein